MPLPRPPAAALAETQVQAPGADGPQPVRPAPSFEEVYTLGFPFVFRVLRSLGVRPPRLEDAAQDVFTVVHRKLAEFEGRSSVKTWLFSIAERVASDYRRAERRKSSQLETLTADLVSDEQSPHADLEAARAAATVDRFVESLSEDKRAVFALVFMEELPAPEAAQILGVPLNTVYSRIRAVRLELRRVLKGERAP